MDFGARGSWQHQELKRKIGFQLKVSSFWGGLVGFYGIYIYISFVIIFLYNSVHSLRFMHGVRVGQVHCKTASLGFQGICTSLSSGKSRNIDFAAKFACQQVYDCIRDNSA